MDQTEITILDALDELIKDKKLTPKHKLVFFGANKSSVFMISKLDGYNNMAMIDNDVRKIGQVISGLTVYTPEDYLKEYDAEIRIIIASEYYTEMCEQLEELGYKRDAEIFVVWRGGRYYDVSKETFDFHTDRAKRGKLLYDSLMGGEEDKNILICPYAGTGDIYLVGLYLERYLSNKHIENYVLTVTSGACKKVAQLFNMNCECITEEKTQELLVYARLVGLKQTRVHVFNDGYLQIMVKRMRGYKDVDFHTMFQRCVFEADERICEANIYQENSDEIFNKYGLIKGKTVLLSPYANTIYSLSHDFWEKLAKVLIEEGYTVCTNSCGESEPPIKGTEGIFIPYNQVIDFLDKAGYFIGMRSGLCDIVSSTSAKMVMFYPNGNIFGACSAFGYFCMEKMGLKTEEVLEIIFDKDESGVLLGNVLSFMEV